MRTLPYSYLSVSSFYSHFFLHIYSIGICNFCAQLFFRCVRVFNICSLSLSLCWAIKQFFLALSCGAWAWNVLSTWKTGIDNLFFLLVYSNRANKDGDSIVCFQYVLVVFFSSSSFVRFCCCLSAQISNKSGQIPEQMNMNRWEWLWNLYHSRCTYKLNKNKLFFWTFF